MSSLLWIVIGFFLFSVALGFWMGWFVRGGQVKKLKKAYRRLVDHAVRGGWVVTEKELLENMAKHGLYVPYVPATFSTAFQEDPDEEV